jgi:hypothetical protein
LITPTATAVKISIASFSAFLLIVSTVEKSPLFMAVIVCACVAFLIVTILKPSIGFVCLVTFVPKVNNVFRFFFRAANIGGSYAGNLQGK